MRSASRVLSNILLLQFIAIIYCNIGCNNIAILQCLLQNSTLLQYLLQVLRILQYLLHYSKIIAIIIAESYPYCKIIATPKPTVINLIFFKIYMRAMEAVNSDF